MHENELIEALKNKDQGAFREIYDRYYCKLKSLSYGIVHNVEDAEDIVQEVFIDMCDSLSRFQQKSSLFTWLHRITLNKSYNFVRSKKVRNIFIGVESLFFQCPDKEDDEDEKTKQINKLHKAIASLPSRQAKVFSLFFYEKLSQKEIAEIMNLKTTSAVEQLIFRAKKNIRKYFSIDDIMEL